jgi:hypothetical protein
MPEDPNEPVALLSDEDSANAPTAPEFTPVERLLADYVETKPAPPPLTADKHRQRPGVFLIFAALVMPSISILVELTTGICADTFFDPLPTVWHKILVIATPMANLLVILSLWRDDGEYKRRLGLANGLAIAVSTFYTIIYLPITPLAILALIYAGLGLLALAPMLSLIASALLLRQLRRLQMRDREGLEFYGPVRKPIKDFGFGFALAALLLAAAEAPVFLTQIWVSKSASNSQTESARAINLLRRYGNEKTLLATCSGRSDFAGGFGVFHNFSNPLSAGQARAVFYRVTGKTYESVRAGAFIASALDVNSDDVSLGIDETGELWGGVQPDLSLAGSRIDGSFDPDAALGYMEWTMVFKNTATFQQEASAQLALPPGGVVSRLTLWVNGEEREAAFAERGKVQAAYDSVVRTRRDPVLVTTNGGDIVNLQCFPVQPNGEMKIRLGITAPMQIEIKSAAAGGEAHSEAQSEAWMLLPYFIERNFRVDSSVTHSVWIESKQPLESSSQNLKPEHPSANLFAVRGDLPHIEMAKAFPAVRAVRSAIVNEARTRDPFSETGEIIAQRIEPKSSSTPMRAVFVIDGSASMRDQSASIADTLAQMPERGEFAMVVASDEVVELAPMQPATSANTTKAADTLKRFDFRGGQDNLPALSRAWEIASQNPDSAIVWIHEPAPMLFGSVDELRQRWERRPSGAHLFDLQTRRGANLITENLRGVAAVNRISRMGDAPQELRRLFSRFSGGSQEFKVTRAKFAGAQPAPPNNSKETSKHLARLWASDEVINLMRRGNDKSSDAAMKLAASYQIVTPLTGAVVLETQEQYQRAGLEPVKSGTVPTIPEPEEWLLMLSALVVLFWILFRRRFACQGV